MNKILLAGVSAVAFALTASAALAFGDNNASVGSNINDNEFGLQAVGNTNSGNLLLDGSNANNDNSVNNSNSGQIAGGDNSVNIDGNLSDNTVASIADASNDLTNEVEFKSTGIVTAGVLDAAVAHTTITFSPGAVDLLGNLTDGVANDASGIFNGVQASSNTTFSNTFGATTVSVDSITVGQP
jgi:hypothetical protein